MQKKSSSVMKSILQHKKKLYVNKLEANFKPRYCGKNKYNIVICRGIKTGAMFIGR